MTRRILVTALLALILSTPVAAARQPQPELLVPGADPVWRETAKERSRRSLFLFFSQQAAMAIFLATLAFGGASARFRDYVTERVKRRWLRDAVFIALVVAMLAAVAFPFDAARFLLSRLYGVATQSFSSWFGDYALALTVDVAIAVSLGLVFYRVVDRRPRTWWRWVTLGALPLAVIAAAGSPLYLSLFNTFTPLDDRVLASRVLDLAAQGGIRAEEVYEADLSRQSRAANAFVTGLGPTTIVALGDTLLDEFSEEEVLFVTAHEMGHYIGRHVWKGVLAGLLLTAIGAWLLQRLCREALARWHSALRVDDLADVASLPLVLLLAGLLAFLGLPIANAISRHFEREADEFALELTVPQMVSPEAAASTFERLGRLGLVDPSPHPAIKFFLWSHPSLDERVEAVRIHSHARGE